LGENSLDKRDSNPIPDVPKDNVEVIADEVAKMALSKKLDLIITNQKHIKVGIQQLTSEVSPRESGNRLLCLGIFHK